MAWPVTGIREIRRYLAVVGPLAFELCVLGVGGKGWGAGVTSRMARGPLPVLRAEIKPQQMSAHSV